MNDIVACRHCGEPVEQPGRWRATIDGVEHELCCAGCQAIAQAIVRAGLADYYRARQAPAARAAGVPIEALQGLRIWDDEQVQARYVRIGEGKDRNCETTLLVDGMRCGACVWLLEQTLRSRPGVVEVSVNLATERATLRWNPAVTRLSSLLEAVARVGYAAQPFDARQREARIRRSSRARLSRLFVAALGMMQVMMYAFPAYVAGPGEIEPAQEQLFRWASLLLTLPVVVYSASPFFAGAWRALRARSAGMDVPVAIGVSAAFAASALATVRGEGEVWFDSVAMFVCLLLAARHLEWIARRRATRAIEAVAAAAPDSAERIDSASGRIERVAATRLAPGDRFRVAAGERIAVDARIVEGSTSIDASLLTGESVPTPRACGDEVPGGAINAGGPIVACVLRSSAESAISTIERLVDRAAAARPRLAMLGERAAQWFVASLLVLAAAVWLAWMQIEPTRALPVAIAVLVVSCPCALSLATPAALAASTGAAIRRGLLIARGDALERIADATDIVFDKTGTLTRGRPELVHLELLEPHAESDRWPGALAVAAALEAGQTHPLADAIRRSVPANACVPACDEPPTSAPGSGVEASIAGRRYRIGARAFVAAWHPALADDTQAHQSGMGSGCPDTLVWLVDEHQPLARIHLRDRLRDEAHGVVAALAAAGLRVHLVSGDRRASVEDVARELGITGLRAEAKPADKLDYVRELQRERRRVWMVGDGINDAPVLAAADVSVAAGNASSLARTAASVVLLAGSLHELCALRALALRTRSIVRQNLCWALAYNAIAIPAAAFGWVEPWLAALGMSASSLLVVANALRLIPPARRAATPRARPVADRVATTSAAAPDARA